MPDTTIPSGLPSHPHRLLLLCWSVLPFDFVDEILRRSSECRHNSMDHVTVWRHVLPSNAQLTLHRQG